MIRPKPTKQDVLHQLDGVLQHGWGEVILDLTPNTQYPLHAMRTIVNPTMPDVWKAIDTVLDAGIGVLKIQVLHGRVTGMRHMTVAQPLDNVTHTTLS